MEASKSNHKGTQWRHLRWESKAKELEVGVVGFLCWEFEGFTGRDTSDVASCLVPQTESQSPATVREAAVTGIQRDSEGSQLVRQTLLY